jgi:hypothetical protein
MRERLRQACATIFCILLCAISSQAQSDFDAEGRWINGISEEPLYFNHLTYTPQNALALQSKWRLIEQENARSKDSQWAGDYLLISETGTLRVLRWSLKEGFVYMLGSGCFPDVRGLNYGKVAFSNHLLQLFPEVNAEDPLLQFAETDNRQYLKANFIASKFIPVKWEGRRYLIAENQMADFYDYVAGSGDYAPRDGVQIFNDQFLLKRQESGKAEANNQSPVVPPGYEHLVKKPVHATIIAVGRRFTRHIAESEEEYERDEWVIPVTLNAGSKHGVKPGLTLLILQKEVGEILRITRVGKKSSKGEVVATIYSGETAEPSVIQTGWRVSTASYKKDELYFK